MSGVFISGVGFYEYVRRRLKCCQEGRSILSLDAKAEPGIVAEIGTGLVLFEADQTNAYVVGRGPRRTYGCDAPLTFPLCSFLAVRALSIRLLIQHANYLVVAISVGCA